MNHLSLHYYLQILASILLSLVVCSLTTPLMMLILFWYLLEVTLVNAKQLAYESKAMYIVTKLHDKQLLS